jgi:DNA invertase Pin-like site-specific DNA recombinase
LRNPYYAFILLVIRNGEPVQTKYQCAHSGSSRTGMYSGLGIKFKSYTEQYVDSLGVFGEAIIGILAAVAQQERIRISERTKAGLARVRSHGKKLGRPRLKDFSKASRATIWRHKKQEAAS